MILIGLNMVIDNNSSAPSVSTVKKVDGAIPESKNNVLKGTAITSWNGGFLKTVAFKKLYAGTKIKNFKIKGQIRMLTPLVPLGTKLNTTFKAYFVPNSRVWDNAEKFSAQKAEDIQVTKEPNISLNSLLENHKADNNTVTEETGERNVFKDTQFRDCKLEQYIPRMFSSLDNVPSGDYSLEFSALPVRGYTAIYNDFERHKELDPKIPENKEDNVTYEEESRAFPINPINYLQIKDSFNPNNHAILYRGLKRNNYYTNFRTHLVGERTTEYPEENISETVDINQSLASHIEWQKTIAEMRENAENAQLNDWEIVAKIRGTRAARQGKVQLIGEKTIGHNYSQVAQTTYNESTPNENFQSLGTVGAYSYTDVDIDIVNYEEIIEDGYLHIIAQTSADTLYSTGINRELLNTKWDEQYRPELKELKDDVLYRIEKDTSSPTYLTESNTTKAEGFKRKYSEIFTLPQKTGGDFTFGGYTDSLSVVNTADEKPNKVPSESFWVCQDAGINDINSPYYYNNYASWKDNTDYLINNTLALKEGIYQIDKAQTGDFQNTGYKVLGKNQFKMIAETEMIADLPIDNAIKDDFKAQGEM